MGYLYNNCDLPSSERYKMIYRCDDCGKLWQSDSMNMYYGKPATYWKSATLRTRLFVWFKGI